MDKKRMLSYAASGLVFVATAIMIFLVLRLDTGGLGITNSEFTPIRNCMFSIGIPCFIKFYISSDREYKEDKRWLIGYGVCVIAWILFVIYACVNPYFANIRTMCFSSFVLIGIATYLEYSMVKAKG